MATVIPKMRVTYRYDRRHLRKRWEVWEHWPGGVAGKSVHHSFHTTEAEARAVARAQAAQDKKDTTK